MTWLHWLGAAMLFLGSTAAGFALRQELRLRLRLLTAVIDSLNLLRSDIVGRLLPLPEALRHLAASAPEPLSAQYAALADSITDGDRPFSGSWAAAFQALDMLATDVRTALLTLGEQLGKYDAQLQRCALDHCRLLPHGCRRTRHSAANYFAASARRSDCSPPWPCFDSTGGAYGR